MSEPSEVQDLCDRLARIAGEGLLLDGVDHVQLRLEWYANGETLGGALPKRADGTTVAIPISLSEYADIDRALRPVHRELRAALAAAGNTDNVFELIVPRDGAPVRRTHRDDQLDANLDADVDPSWQDDPSTAGTPSVAGEGTTAEATTVDPGEPESPAVDPSTIPTDELLSLLFERVSAAAPEPWTRIVVTAEVFEEAGKRAVRSSYAVAGPDGAPGTEFQPPEAIVCLNAVLHLRSRMAAAGEAWSRADITFDRTGAPRLEPRG